MQIPPGFHLAPSWALQLGQIGQWAILAAAVVLLVGAGLFIFAPKRAHIGTLAFVIGVAAIFVAGACLALLFLYDQFEFKYVAEHSWKDLSLAYKIAAIWSGQQGSFLLWATTSAIFGLLTLGGTGKYRRWYVTVFSLFLATLCGILCYESPFSVFQELTVGNQVYAPDNGQGLVPSLQNYWVVIHPPTIFLGFGSLTVLFAYAMSAMLTRDLKGWVSRVRPWALVSVAVLGLGVVMGGLWAYETQGWGGFWAWDPAENVSLVPWLLTAAFIHGIIVQTTRQRWSGSNVFLGALPFLLFFYGTFLVRSGFLDKFSVHSFAEMNRSALWILLGALIVAIVAFLSVWFAIGIKLARSADAPATNEGFARESAYRTAVIIIVGLAVSVALGMSVPFLIGLMGKEARIVEEPLYHQVVVWFFLPIMLLMAIVPFLSWKRMRFPDLMNRVAVIIGAAVCLVSITYFLGHSSWDTSAMLSFPFGFQVPRVPWVMLLFWFAAVTAIGNSWRLVEMFRKSKMGVGGFVAHLGIATVMAGLILSRGLEKKQQALVMEGTPAQAMGYTVSVKGMTSDPATDRDNRVQFVLASLDEKGNDPSFVANPRFFYTAMQGADPEAFTGPHVERRLSHDIYVSLAPPLANLWEEPQHFMVGESKEGDSISITYLGLTRHGDAGHSGTAFGARLKIIEEGRTYFAEPKFVIGLGPDSPQATPSLKAMLVGMNAADHSILLQMPYNHTLYPLEIYYKPMTILIWIGTALMTVGGLLSAFYRKRVVGKNDAQIVTCT